MPTYPDPCSRADRRAGRRQPRLLAIVGELYELGGPASQCELETLASRWSPWRTWVTVLMRAAGARVLGGDGVNDP